MGHRYYTSTGIPKIWHMYIYCICHLYDYMNDETKALINECLGEADPAYVDVLQKAIKTDENLDILAGDYYVSNTTIRRAKRKFYRSMYEKLKKG